MDVYQTEKRAGAPRAGRQGEEGLIPSIYCKHSSEHTTAQGNVDSGKRKVKKYTTAAERSEWPRLVKEEGRDSCICTVYKFVSLPRIKGLSADGCG